MRFRTSLRFSARLPPPEGGGLEIDRHLLLGDSQMIFQRNKLAAADVSGNEPAVRDTVKDAIGWSFVDAFRRVMFVGSGLAAASAITALVLLKPTGATRNVTAT